MSTVELVVRKVRKMSSRQAKEVLGWLAEHEPKKSALKNPARRARRKSKYPNMKELLAWYDSIRLTTDWEPPRMPNDLVEPSRFKW